MAETHAGEKPQRSAGTAHMQLLPALLFVLASGAGGGAATYFGLGDRLW